MSPILLSEEEIDRLGDTLYEQLRSQVETEENLGKLISIDTQTGDYEIADDLLIAGKRLQARHPDAKMVGKRIGYNAVYTVGGMLTRTSSK
jgi:hypothetical protein